MFNKLNRNNKDSFVKEKFRINDRITANIVLVIKEDNNLGTYPIEEAKRLARENELDLVEISPRAKPPVCKIIDFNKFKYENSIKEKLEKKKQKESIIELKQLRISPNICENDLELKINCAIKFLQSNNNVQFICKFKNRQKAHKDIGNTLYNKITAKLKEYGVCKTQPQTTSDSFNFTIDSIVKGK